MKIYFARGYLRKKEIKSKCFIRTDRHTLHSFASFFNFFFTLISNFLPHSFPSFLVSLFIDFFLFFFFSPIRFKNFHKLFCLSTHFLIYLTFPSLNILTPLFWPSSISPSLKSLLSFFISTSGRWELYQIEN